MTCPKFENKEMIKH